MGKNEGKNGKKACQKRDFAKRENMHTWTTAPSLFGAILSNCRSLLPPPFSLPLQKQKQRKTRTEYTGAHLSTKRDKCRGKP